MQLTVDKWIQFCDKEVGMSAQLVNEKLEFVV